LDLTLLAAGAVDAAGAVEADVVSSGLLEHPQTPRAAITKAIRRIFINYLLWG